MTTMINFALVDPALLMIMVSSVSGPACIVSIISSPVYNNLYD